jgi:hypothetical protein
MDAYWAAIERMAKRKKTAGVIQGIGPVIIVAQINISTMIQ